MRSCASSWRESEPPKMAMMKAAMPIATITSIKEKPRVFNG
jgi:hypothetical protein